MLTRSHGWVHHRPRRGEGAGRCSLFAAVVRPTSCSFGGESVPAVELSSTPMSEHTVPVPMGECVPAVDSFSTPSSGRSSAPSSQTLAWGDAGDSSVPLSVPLSPNHVQAGRSQDIPDEGSLFHVSPISPGFQSRPLREAQPFPLEGVLLPSTIDDFSDSDLGAPITYAQCELIPGLDTPLSLPVFSVPSGLASRPDQSSIQTVLTMGTSSRPEVGSSAVASSMDVEDSPLLETGLPGCPFHFRPYSGQTFADGNPAFGLQLHHPRFLEFVGAPRSARLLYRSPMFWVDQLGKDQAMAAAVNLQRNAGIMLSNLQILSQFAMSLSRMSSEMMDLGIGQMVFPHDEVAGMSPAPRAARAAKYMSAMGLWRPRTGPGDSGPVPASTCRSCMTCDYCFPEDQLPLE